MRKVALCIAVTALVVGCGRGPKSAAEAQQVAKERFEKVCSNFHLSAPDYDGPISTSVGGAAFAYEWRKKEKKSEGFLITVASDGITNVSSFP